MENWSCYTPFVLWSEVARSGNSATLNKIIFVGFGPDGRLGPIGGEARDPQKPTYQGLHQGLPSTTTRYNHQHHDAEGSHYIDYQIADHVFAGFCILQIGQIGQFDVFGYIADGSAYCLRNLA